MAEPPARPHTVVVGAGVAGLTIAHQLIAQGRPPYGYRRVEVETLLGVPGVPSAYPAREKVTWVTPPGVETDSMS